MNEEYFDIVDEDNKPTGEKRLRSEAHATGLWHRIARVYLFSEAGGNIYVLKIKICTQIVGIHVLVDI